MSDQPLYDFLYADHERVASLLAQITRDGALTESQKSGARSKTGSQGGTVDLKLIRAEGKQSSDVRQEVRETYDPLWLNSIKLINEQSSNGFSQDAPLEVGQLRVLSGTLLCYDHSLVSKLVSSGSFSDLIAANVPINDASQSGKNRAAQGRENKALSEIIKDFLQALPLGIGFILVTDIGHLWFSVKREYLSLLDLDIPLKFITHVSGTWNVLGIIDAKPNDHVSGVQPVIDMNIDGLLPPMALNVLQMIGAIAVQFGRPLPAWGIKPIAVYRDITLKGT